MSEDKPKHGAGRPTKYCPEIVEIICDKVSTHPYSLSKVCEMFEEMPNQETINLWCYKYPEFSDRYNRALVARCDILAEYTLTIADNVKSYKDKEEVERIDPGILKKAQLMIATRNHLASKLQPQKWGDAIANMSETEKDQLLQQLLKSKEKLDEGNKKDF